MGCSESKSSIAVAGNTVTQNKKPAAADYPKKVEKEEDVVVEQGEDKAEENKGPEGTAGVDVKEGMREATVVAEVEKKDDMVKEKPEKLDENVKKRRNRNRRKKMERVKLQRMRKAQPRKQNLHLRPKHRRQ